MESNQHRGKLIILAATAATAAGSAAVVGCSTCLSVAFKSCSCCCCRCRAIEIVVAAVVAARCSCFAAFVLKTVTTVSEQSFDSTAVA